MLLSEWSKQDGILLTWPHSETDWRDNLPEVETVYIELVSSVSEYQHIYIICHTEELLHHVKKLLRHCCIDNVFYFIIQTNDTWCRDYGPIVTSHGEDLQIEDFQFNGWGEKFTHARDNAVTKQLVQEPCFKKNNYREHDFILEGGSIESNGAGILLTTSNCLLTSQRSSNGNKSKIENYLKKTFSLKQVIWLEGQLPGDDTDGHIDTLARFCNENLICAVPEVYDQLTPFQFDIVKLPSPRSIFAADGHPLPATYANFLITNQEVIIPTYSDSNDEEAISLIQDCFADRQMKAINSLPLIEQHGSIHCITMQILAGVFEQ